MLKISLNEPGAGSLFTTKRLSRPRYWFNLFWLCFANKQKHKIITDVTRAITSAEDQLLPASNLGIERICQPQWSPKRVPEEGFA